MEQVILLYALVGIICMKNSDTFIGLFLWECICFQILRKQIVNAKIMGIQIWRKKRVNYNKFEVVTKQHNRLFKFLVTIKTHCVEKILPPFTFCFPYFC